MTRPLRLLIVSAVLLSGLALSPFVANSFARFSWQRLAVNYNPVFSCDDVTEIPTTECQALEALYSSTNGPGWTNSTNWLATNTPHDWYGVTVSGGHVYYLYLDNNLLSGNIPPKVGDLTGLVELSLGNNQLSGSIPPESGNLVYLVSLHLDNNQLSGSIPPELGGLSNLTDFSVSNNALSGEIPETLTNLINLETGDMVNIGYNMLTSSNPAVITFFNTKDPDWADTQTIPPTNLQATPSSGSVLLAWEPITYTQDGGYYEIGYSLSANGTYTVHGTTPDKLAASYRISNLPSNKYYFRLRTNTPAHGDQQNNLWSEYSQVVSATIIVPALANFSATPTSGIAPLSVTFTNLSKGDYATCAWEFGDSGTSTACVGPTHQYTTPGIYTVTLTVTGPGGADSETKASYITAYTPVLANFSATPTSGVTPLSVTFTNLSKGDYATCAWEFGDSGTSSVCLDPNHVYPNPGTYTVTLTVSGLGGSDTLSQAGYITVTEGAEITVSPGMGGKLVYSDTTGGGIVVEVPGAAVTETITLVLNPIPPPTAPSGLSFAGHAFELKIYQDGIPLENFTFQVPVTITIQYTDENVVGLNESTLTLDFWSEATSQWFDAASTCMPSSSYNRHPDENWLSVPICHLTRFALFGEVQPYHLYLPLLERR